MAQYISKDAVVEASYDSDSKQLVLAFETTDGTETVNFAIDDLVDIKTAEGNGFKFGKRLTLC